MRPISLSFPMIEGWIMNREGPTGRDKAAIINLKSRDPQSSIRCGGIEDCCGMIFDF